MEISTKYNPANVESKWYEHWINRKFFSSIPDEREPFTIVIPPPNVTGVLHMGHILNNTLQDVLIRRARMMGKNACWVPGTDHASIATEAKVVQKLRKEGIKKSDLTRDEFMEHAWEWKEKHGGMILEQLKKLGCSCDWDRTRFTMEPKLSDAVIKVFVDLYKTGHIYRGWKIINWDPKAKTTLSNEEVIYKEELSKLYFVNYQIEGSDEIVTIATTRPESILGDTAVCVNPKDERYAHLQGKNAIVPKVNRAVPFIFDEYVDMEFGTGALKVTPAHDVNDYDLGQKHNLETINIMNDDGTLNETAEFYVGEDRFEARKQIVADLVASGQLIKTEEFTNKVGYSERNHDTVVEPRLSRQWFVDMSKLVVPALENVMNNTIRFHPPKYKNTYRHWMENIRDWPISRQLWWGQRIPAFYYGEDGVVVAETAEEALEIARNESGNSDLSLSDLKQDEDVLDTWFSSWLWPISVFDGFENQHELNYYYPTNVLITGWDIIFFWVARMIVAGYEFMDEKPFSDVYFTGMVRDKQGRKMSKSLGNSPEPLDLIRDYGADGVRVGMMLCSPAGGDLLFEEKLCEQGRNFSNKIWNAMRLVKGWEVKEGKNEANETAINWFRNRFNHVLDSLNASFDSFRISEALMSCYTLVWDDFCSWYLEMVKPDYQKPVDRFTYDHTVSFLEELMRMLHPFMPFITEEIWHVLRDREEDDCVIVSQWPIGGDVDQQVLQKAEVAKEVISAIRDIRQQNNIKVKEPLKVVVHTDDFVTYEMFKPIISKLAFLDHFKQTREEKNDQHSFVYKSDQFFVDTGIEVDAEVERTKLQEELNYTEGFLNSVQKKLSNERFVNNAPEAVVENERKKLRDGQAKLRVLAESLAKLN